jgi:16S rRNA (cytosine967-C5)-methyltransferase
VVTPGALSYGGTVPRPAKNPVPSPAPLSATLDLASELLSFSRPADAVIASWLRARRDLTEAQRGPVLKMVGVLLRHHARLGWWLARCGMVDTPRSRLLAWLVLDGNSLGTVASWMDSDAGDFGTPLAAERDALSALEGQSINHADMPDAVRLEYPDWARDGLRRRFGGEFATELQAMLTEPPLDFRVNPVKSSRPAMLEALKGLGLDPQPMELAPQGIRLNERISLSRLPMLRSGELEIQDEGSQLIAQLVDARPGERVVDFCAGAGGKTLAIAAQMQNRGYVVACDVSEGRLQRAAERFRRAGLHNIQTRLLSSESDRWVKRHKLGFDRVLVDAPCSGTGTWRRNPDARWRPHDEAGLAGLVALQARILASAARLVKPGGKLVYSTCSLLIEENQEQIAAFLAAHPGFRLVPVHTAGSDTDYLTLTPARHGTDGFFAASLERLKEPAG